jgi:hypothetical protein
MRPNWGEHVDRFARSSRLTVLLAVAGALIVKPALADSKNPTPEELSAARELAKDGVRLAREGNCAEALPKLERARALYETPVIPAVSLGDCLIRAGKIVRGTEVLQLVVRQDLGPKPEKFNVDAKASAQTLLDAALAKIARLTLHVVAPPGRDVTLTIDQEVVPKALVDIARPTDPGEHVVEASAAGSPTTSQTVKLRDGESAEVTLTVVAGAAPPLTETVAVPPAPAPAKRSKGPAIALLTVGGAGLVTGAVAGVIALGKRSSLDTACPTHVCSSSSSSDISSLKSVSWVSTVGFAAGIAGVGAGVTLLLLPPSSAPSTSRVQVRPIVGFGQLGLAGEF